MVEVKEEDDDDDVVLIVLLTTIPIVFIAGIVIGLWAYMTKCWKQPCKSNKNSIKDQNSLDIDRL